MILKIYSLEQHKKQKKNRAFIVRKHITRTDIICIQNNRLCGNSTNQIKIPKKISIISYGIYSKMLSYYIVEGNWVKGNSY